MSDPHVREVGRLPGFYADEPLIVGVECDAVTIQLGEWPVIALTEARAEDFMQLFVRACWVAAAQGGAP